MTGKLIKHAYDIGYELSEGRGWESPEANKANGGKEHSNHLIKLAHDWNVFKKGVWLMDGKQFKDLGTYWKTLALDACWGGDWDDGNHFSIEHEGYK